MSIPSIQQTITAPFEIPPYWKDLHQAVIDYLIDAFPKLDFAPADLDLAAFFACCALCDPTSPIREAFLECAEKEWNKNSHEILSFINKKKKDEAN